MELSMEWQTILLIAGTLVCYTLITIVIPAVVFRPALESLPYSLRMMGYYCIGNTLTLYIVFILEFLHISYPITLFIFTFLVYLYFFLHLRGKSIHGRVKELYNTVNQLSTKVITVRTIYARRSDIRKQIRTRAKGVLVDIFLKHIIEWVLLVALLGYGFWTVGSENIAKFGYHAYDVPVHNAWINSLIRNKPFEAGVYPLGFHVMVYYLHEIFHIRVMDLLRIFGLVNLTFVLLNMCGLMKSIFRQRYLFALGAFVFIGFNPFTDYGTTRFMAGLPQEHAMIFIFPSVAFAIAFFHFKYERKKMESLSPLEAQERSDIKEDKSTEKARLNRDEKKVAKELKKVERAKAKEQAKQDKSNKARAKLVVRQEKKKIAEKAEKLKVQQEKGRFAGAKSSRERREFERLAKKIAKEKGRELKNEEKKKTLPDHSYDFDEEVLTVDKVISASSSAESVPAERESITVAESVPDERESITVDPVKNETSEKPVVKVETEKVRWYQKIWRGYLHFLRRIKVSLSREDTLCMFLFSLAFGMSIAVHFYATIIAVLLYFGIALGYGVRFFRPTFFVPILKAVFLGVAISFSPFIIALCMGIPLQGSLTWALEVIRPAPTATYDETDEEEYEDREEVDGSDPSEDAEDEDFEAADDTGDGAASSGEEGTSSDHKSDFVLRRPAIVDRGIAYFERLIRNTRDMMDYFIIRFDIEAESMFPMGQIFFGIMLVLLAAAVITFLFIREYAMNLLSMFFGLVFVDLVFLGSLAGLPSLMEQYRVAVFFVPILCIGAAMAVDGAITVVFGWLHWKYVKWIPHLAALCSCVLCIGAIYRLGYMREPSFYVDRGLGLSLNGAITCTERILSENRDFTYTIVSANEELQMMNLYGYHYEDIVLLHKLENVDTSGSAAQANFNILQDDPEDESDPNIFIPTKFVYFYIEKKPMVYLLNAAISKINNITEEYVASSEGAKYAAPVGRSSNNYMGTNRWIVMSHMYMWMHKLRQIYPEAISVYYEDDEFICYRMTQGSIPYNLGIDYGYNDAQEELDLSDQ